MPDCLNDISTSRALKTDDIFRSSYGVGHHWRTPYYFPDSEALDRLSTEQTIGFATDGYAVRPCEHYKTTTESTHNIKIIPDEMRVYKNPQAPHHWNLHYINEFRSRYLARRPCRSLSPSTQKTETHDSYQVPNVPPELWRPLCIKPFVLKDHHDDGSSKRIFTSDGDSSSNSNVLYPKNNEVLRELDPYSTTTMRTHRFWSKEELKGYPKKDIATYWDLDGVPKALGFGVKSSPISKDGVPHERAPMRDTATFREATDQTRIRPVTYHVPHTGLKTLYQTDFEQPSSMLQREDKLCPVECPFILPDPSSKSSFATPSMYQTEYSTIGKCQREIL